MRALDLFAGLGGMDLAAESLGWQADGVEIMPAALATRSAGGLKTVAYDVRTVEIRTGEYDAVLGGPPCQPFSPTGNGEGRAALDAILHAVRTYGSGPVPEVGDARTSLVLEPLRLILAALPTFVVLEQVPTALPVWKAYAERLTLEGYSAAAGVLSAERYGVPQTRKRAFLVARRDGRPATLPTPTHERPVSMGDALGWPDDWHTVSNYGTNGDPRKRGIRYATQPSATITSKANRIYVVGGGDRRRLTQREALLLQTFPADFPVQGGTLDRFLQIGNAVPPTLARAVLEAATT